MGEDKRPVMVSIQCLAYNHEPYIRQCLDGIVMQQTNFPFEAIVHDDASTDNTAKIIREYAEKYPDIIKPIVEKENQYSKRHLFSDLIPKEAYRGKYIAMCECDDYWIDPLKLQKQVDFMENHPECSMVCNRTKLYSEKERRFVGDSYCYHVDGFISPKDIILRGGLFISTCSVLYRSSIMQDGYPDYCTKCHVGDYPLQIYAAMKGHVYYFNDLMSVYRIDNSNSWAGQRKQIDIEKRISTVKSEVQMLKGFANDYPVYENYFKTRMMAYVNLNFPSRKYSIGDQNRYVAAFCEEIKSYPFLWNLDLRIRRIRMRGILKFYPYRRLKAFRERIFFVD